VRKHLPIALLEGFVALFALALLGSLPKEATPAPTGAGGSSSGEAGILAPDSGIEWQPERGRECRRYKRRFICDGPRKVPRPLDGEASDRAKALGLGKRLTASHLLLEPPREGWVEAAREPPSAEVSEELLWPVPGGKLWRGFGRVKSRGRRRMHKGVDIGASEGTPILSVADGIVAYSDNRVRGYGNLLLVVHGDGSVAFYAHCKATYLYAGQRVRAGQTIGLVGTTGITQGAHLHFELRVEGQATDPLPRLRRPPPAEAEP